VLKSTMAVFGSLYFFSSGTSASAADVQTVDQQPCDVDMEEFE
jgi:hypothetical protein